MSNYKICYHIMPYEVDYALLTFTQLKKSSYYLGEDNITIETCLNLSDYLIDWNKSKLPKEFFIAKYKALAPLLKDYNHIPKIYEGDKLYGSLDLQREATQKDIDFYMTICPDMYFSETCLADIINASKMLHYKYFVITPEISKMWDFTWDEITNENLQNINYGKWDEVDIFDVRSFSKVKGSHLEHVSKAKFAGWFDLYNKAFWEEMVPIPLEWSGYGPHDFYSMLVSEKVKDFQQFVLRNQVIFEYSTGPLKQSGFSKYYKDLLHFNDIPNQRKEFESKLPQYLKDWEIYAKQKQII